MGAMIIEDILDSIFSVVEHGGATGQPKKSDTNQCHMPTSLAESILNCILSEVESSVRNKRYRRHKKNKTLKSIKKERSNVTFFKEAKMYQHWSRTCVRPCSKNVGLPGGSRRKKK